MSATAPASDNQAVSNQDIQQILTEVRALNRRMDTLNTRLFGNPEGDTGERFVIDKRHPHRKFTFASVFLRKGGRVWV